MAQPDRFRRKLLLLASLPLLAMPALAQNDLPEDDEAWEQTIIVTGARIRQGGAQDVQHFRSIAMDSLRPGLPDTDSLTLEGLLGEHDLALPDVTGCEQIFCIAAHAMPGNLMARPDDAAFVGIGFGSNIDAASYSAEPLSLVAVVDRSGSMGGLPIARVKEALHAAIDQLGEGDRMGIVLYGTTTLVHQPVTDVAQNREALHRAVDAIAIDGSTYMEAGMRLGFATALAELPQSNGRTRLMLFTDENPNVGNTSAEGFMAQAIAGSQQGVGMTTIGVGAHFDGALATRVSSVRGGNLFFVPREGSAHTLFEREFANMVSEVAQDLVISIDPAEGYSVTGVYGVPGEMIAHSGEGTVTVTVGSAFLSSNGGGIYASLAGPGGQSGPPLAELTVGYTATATQRRESDSAAVVLAAAGPPENLRRAQLLVDQYFGMRQALALHHEGKDTAGAADMLASLASRIEQSGMGDMSGELALVSGLRDNARQLAGLELARGPQPWHVVGNWRVLRHERVDDLSRGDLVAITADGEFITHRMSGREAGEEIYQTFAINERQMHIEDTRLVLDYAVRGDRLTLRNRLDGTSIVLERQPGEA